MAHVPIERWYDIGMLIQVAVSGAVGKQVFKTSGNNTFKCKLESITLTPSAANATIKIRDGNASGDVVFFGRAPSAQGSKTFEVCHPFTKGVHVKVIGTLAEAYLDIS